MTQPPEIFQRIYDQHGHRCPMSTLGGRMGLAALKSFSDTADSLLSVLFEHGTCAVDGIEITTGCSRSTGSLRVEDSGRHSLVVSSGQSRSVRISLNEFALATAWEYRTADEAFNAGKGNLAADELKRLCEQKETVLQTVLEKLWTLPDEALLTVEMI
jgi:formylmethanofuran dehydrogenase subunit E